MAIDVTAMTEQVRAKSKFTHDVLSEVGKVVVGQKNMLQRIMMALLCDGHILLEGLPGLAKTLTIKTFADVIAVDFQRVQFTPDLLPSDLIGTVIYNQRTGEFTPKLGPIHTNIVLADEINRAPAKVQSALLEAMGEKQVTIADQTYKLKDPFIVLATQNPIEQEGTYPLPEAQMDRFMFKVKVQYPTVPEEKMILDRMTVAEVFHANRIINAETILDARKTVAHIYMDEKIKDYILSIVFASRFPEKYSLSEIKSFIQVGASPRATIYLTKAARASAFLSGRGYVTPEDVKSIAYDVLRHRIHITYEAEADEIDSDQVIKRILDRIEVP